MAKKRKNNKNSKKPSAAQKAAVGAQLVNTTQHTPESLNAPYGDQAKPESNIAEAPSTQNQASTSHTQNTKPSVLMSFRVDAQLREDFNACCREQDLTGSQILRRYMKGFIERHNGAGE